MSKIVPFNFHGDQLDVIQEGKTIWVSVRRVCECLGVDYSRQLKKLKTLSWATMDIMATVGLDGKQREMSMVDTQTLLMWLANIHENKVSEDIRPKLILFQKECVEALHNHFFGKSLMKVDKNICAQQRAATANVAELRRFIKDGHVGAKQLLQFSKTMWKAVPTCDKEFWRTKIKDSFENCEKFASFKTIMNNFQEYGIVPSFQELVENSRELPSQLTQGTPVTEETDSIRTVTEIPDNYFTVEGLSNYVYGSTAPNNIRTVLYALKYHHFDVDSDHCLRVIPIRGEGSLHPFYVYSRRVLNVLQSTKDTRMI